MFEYMRTVLNGLKAWVTGEVNKLLSKIDAVGVVASRASNVATKNKNSIGMLRGSLGNVTTTAEVAQNIAYTARNTAETARNTAETAQSTAEKAQRTAKNAQTTADNALPAYGTSYIRPTKNSSISGTIIKFVGDSSSPSIVIEESNNIRGPRFFASRSTISIGTLSHSSFSHCSLSTSDGNVSKLELTSGNGSRTSLYSNGKIIGPNGVDINLIKTGGVILSSSTPDSTKKFKITVDDSGTISATEVTE